MKRTILLLSCLFTIVTAVAQTSYSLDSCKALARKNNVEIRNADIDIQVAQEVKKQALTKYFPNVTGAAVGYHAMDPLLEYGIDNVENMAAREMLHKLYFEYGLALGLPNSIAFCEKGVSVGATVMQPLFMGGRIVNGNRLAKVGVEAAELQRNLVQQQSDLQTETYYWTIISLQEKQKTLSQVSALLDTLFRDVTAAHEAGFLVENDVMRVALKQNEMKSNELKVNNGIKLAKMALCQHIGIPYDANLKLQDSLSSRVVNPDVFFVDEETAVAQRDEYRLLLINSKAEELKRKMVLGEALPQLLVGVGGSYGSMVFDKYNFNGLAFATLQVPLSGWWETAHKLKEQKLKEQKAINLQNDLSEKMSLETRQTWNELTEAYQQLQLSELTVSNAQKNLKVATDNFQAGLIPVSELLEAQTLFRQALDQQVDDTITYQLKQQKYSQLTK